MPGVNPPPNPTIPFECNPGRVPQSYFYFVMFYAPWFYVVTTAMAADPPQGQKDVLVTDGSKFSAGMVVEIKDSAHNEWNEVDSINGNTLI